MDGERFDALTRSMARGVSRRHLLRNLGGVLGGLVAALGAEEAVACTALGGRCRRARTCCSGACKNRKCACPSGQTNCGGSCVNTNTDNNNCGTCGNACSGGRPTCVQGTCQAANCPSGSDFCSHNVVNCATGCGCVDALDGSPFCASSLSCIACTDDADCTANPAAGPGSVCVAATGELCTCTAPKRCAIPC